VLLFCGSSSIQQFALRDGGSIGRFAFTGASMIGLVNDKSTTGHGQIVRTLVKLPGTRQVVLLFGNVDLDFMYYRQCGQKGIFPIEDHFTRCITAYNRYIQSLLDEAEESGNAISILVLAPQLTPLRDSVFTEVTARHARVQIGVIQALEGQMDLSHRERLARTRRFNDRLEQEILPDPRVRLFRIDHAMVDADGALHERFYPPRVQDHHATIQETFPLWRAALSQDLRIYERFRPAPAEAPPIAAVA